MKQANGCCSLYTPHVNGRCVLRDVTEGLWDENDCQIQIQTHWHAHLKAPHPPTHPRGLR